MGYVVVGFANFMLFSTSFSKIGWVVLGFIDPKAPPLKSSPNHLDIFFFFLLIRYLTKLHRSLNVVTSYLMSFR